MLWGILRVRIGGSHPSCSLNTQLTDRKAGFVAGALTSQLLLHHTPEAVNAPVCWFLAWGP